MGLNNPIENDKTYFLTLTVVDWIDVFTRPEHKTTIVDSLRYCQQNKGLELFAWVLMSNHLHMIARAAEKQSLGLSDILRDFKKHTSLKIVNDIKEYSESRREWMLDRFEFAGRFDSKITNHRFWQAGNEPKEIISADFLQQKLDYIHNNPVKAMIVRNPHEYIYSSASNYAGMESLLDVIVL